MTSERQLSYFEFDTNSKAVIRKILWVVMGRSGLIKELLTVPADGPPQ